jgi:DNA-binding HxlR family transcriptional regulator
MQPKLGGKAVVIVEGIRTWYTGDMEKSINPVESSFEHSSIHNTLAVIGDRWTLCVLSEAFSGIRRFDEMREHLSIASNILSNRLTRLVNYDILEQVPYKEGGRRTRYEYRLTRKGLDLLPALVALIQWGDHYMPDSSITSATMIHADCGQEVHVEINCANGHTLKSVTHLKRIVQVSSPPQE